ncbi:MAG: NTP transferase domain-containing protein, partial [Epsilonproteobacteria bacterium]|nr:NTP transferase domain-containing protein [Campylobacterota bacterium]
MKRDKALLPFRGYKSLASYQYKRLKPLFNNLYISAKDNKFDFNAPILYDKTNIYSPLAAIYSILTQLKEDIFIIAVDMPLISIASIKELIDIYSKSSYEIYSFEVDKK